jgi:hypothetical protein
MEMRQTYARVKSETRDGSLNEIHDVVRLLLCCVSVSLTPFSFHSTQRQTQTQSIQKQVRSIPALQQKYRGLNLHINIAEFLKARFPPFITSIPMFPTLL